MTTKSLEDRINEVGNPVDLLRNSKEEALVFPIQGEFSNWIDEQEAWRRTAVLFDQSYHMTDLYVEGPDTIRLLSEIGVNSFKSYGRNRAKQLVCCNYEGYVIGDGILFGLEDDRVQIVGRPPISNWVMYKAQTGGYDVQVEIDPRSRVNARPRKTYRFEVQGPNAWQILEKLNGAPISDIKFFAMGEIQIAGRKVRCLRHGMSGAPGLELWGPKEEGDEIRAVILEAGKEFGLLAAGARAYSTVAFETGWLASPMPAIYTGKDMKAYREWLPATGFEATSSLGGSMVTKNIEDYYFTPYDLGYGHFTRFDHDFIGREALEKKAKEPSLKKVTLVWNPEDVLKIQASMMAEGDRYKYLDLPAARYSTLPYDMIMADREQVGIGTYAVYTSNGRAWISLSLIDEKYSSTGAQVELVWGEPDGLSPQKVTVERHAMTKVRCTVVPAPFAEEARGEYRPYLRRAS